VQSPLPPAGKVVDMLQRAVMFAQHLGCDPEYVTTKAGQEAFAVCLEERCAEVLLKLFQGHRDRRGRPMKPLRSIAYIATFSHMDKDAQGVCADHRKSISRDLNYIQVKF
jgi:hypothetical protein